MSHLGRPGLGEVLPNRAKCKSHFWFSSTQMPGQCPHPSHPPTTDTCPPIHAIYEIWEVLSVAKGLVFQEPFVRFRDLPRHR